MILTSNSNLTLIVPSEKDGERFSTGKTISGFFMGKGEIKAKKEKPTDADEYRVIFKFKSIGGDGFREGEEFAVFSTGLLKWQMDIGVPNLCKRAGVEMPEKPFLTLINEGKKKVKGFYTWKIEFELDLDKKIEDYFGYTDVQESTVDASEPHENNKDNWESSESEGDNCEF